MQFDAAVERFIAQQAGNGRSIHTINQYRYLLGQLRGWLVETERGLRVDRIQHETLAEYLISDRVRLKQDGTPKKPITVNVSRSALRRFFGYVHEAGYILENPARLIKLAKCGKSPPRVLAESEIKRLFEVLAAAKTAAGRRDHVLFTTMHETGARLSSVLAARVADLRLESGELLLRETKGQRPQVVQLPSKLRRQLQGYVGKRTEGWLFPARDGTRLGARSAQRSFAAWARRAEVISPGSPHALRHSFAVGLYVETRDVLLVKRALGHRSLETTLRYAERSE